MRSVSGHPRVQSDCWFPYAPMSKGIVRHQVSSRIRSVESSTKPKMLIRMDGMT